MHLRSPHRLIHVQYGLALAPHLIVGPAAHGHGAAQACAAAPSGRKNLAQIGSTAHSVRGTLDDGRESQVTDPCDE